MSDPFDLPQAVKDAYVFMKTLPDGRICGVHRLMYHWTLHVDIDYSGYHNRYCYQTQEGATAALEAWDGTGDPEGWHRAPETGRRRDPATGREWIAW